MDKELQQLQAPKRSNEIRQLSYTTIQTKIAQRKKRQNIHYYSIVMAAAVLFMLLATSFFNNNTELVNKQTATNPLTIERGYITTNDSTENLTFMTKWYYFDKNKLNEYELSTLQPFVTKLSTSNMLLEKFPQTPNKQLLLVMSNGRIVQLTLLSDSNDIQHDVLIDVNTKQALKLTMDESMDITAIFFDSANKSLRFIFELFIIILLFLLYGTTVHKISPKKKEKLELKTTKYYFLVGLAFYILYTFVSGLSLYYFHSHNGLFIASVMASLLLVKTLIEYYNGRFDRSIFEVPIFFIFVLLFTFVKFL